MERMKTYFIGAGPSIAMGIPSVDELYGKIVEDQSINIGGARIGQYVSAVYPNLEGNKLNFEELLTILDSEGIGPEIFKLSRSGEDEYPWSPGSIHATYEELMKRAFKVIHDQMSDLEKWEQFAQMKAPNDPAVKEEILSKRRTFEPIRNAWEIQFRKINKGILKDCVLTTNYDLWIEKWASNGYTYMNLDSQKTLIIKLHGSINWQKRTSGQFFEKEYFQNCEILSFEKETRVLAFPLEKILGMISFATDIFLPIIVPPMALKRYEEPLFRQMFWNASNILMNSEELVIIGYRFSDFDFYVKKMIDHTINSNESRIKRIYHYDCDDSVRVKFEKMLRKKVDYKFINADFRRVVPDFDNLGEISIIS
jgi:hypothetical protein